MSPPNHQPPFETIAAAGRHPLPTYRELAPGEKTPTAFWGPITVRKRRALREAERRYRLAIHSAREAAEVDDGAVAAAEAYRGALQALHAATPEEREELLVEIPDLLADNDLITARQAELLELAVIDAAERRTLETLAIVIDGVEGDLELHDRELRGVEWPRRESGAVGVELGRMTVLEGLSEVAIHGLYQAVDAAFKAGADGLREDEAGN